MAKSEINRFIPVRSLSVVAPAYNEAAGITEIILEWITYLRNVSSLADFEIVICNDGSRDLTGAILDGLAKAYPCLKPIHHEKNQGAAAALTSAIRNTKYQWVLLIDSDGQYEINNLEPFIVAVEKNNSKAAIGVRTAKHDTAFVSFGSWSSGWLCNFFHGKSYHDFNCALKLVEGETLRSLILEAKGLNYSGEVSSKLIERGIKMTEVQVKHQPRVTGRSSAQNIKAAWQRLLFVLYIGFRQFLIAQKVLQVHQDEKSSWSKSD